MGTSYENWEKSYNNCYQALPLVRTSIFNVSEQIGPTPKQAINSRMFKLARKLTAHFNVSFKQAMRLARGNTSSAYGDDWN